jgi:protein TonB
MYALDEEPEKGGRWGRFGVGLTVALGLALGLVFGADSIVPAARALSSVVQMTVVEEPLPEMPKQEELPPPPPLEAPKPRPQQKSKAPEVPQPAAANPTPQPEASDQVGLDADSFGSGSGGPAFNVGSTQMGVPGARATSGVAPTPVAPPPKPRFVEAKPRAGNLALYPERARRMGIQGLMVIETEIDERGRVTRAVVRSKLDPELDELVRKALLTWTFEPATVGGQATRSTKFVRVRFQLQR